MPQGLKASLSLAGNTNPTPDLSERLQDVVFEIVTTGYN